MRGEFAALLEGIIAAALTQAGAADRRQRSPSSGGSAQRQRPRRAGTPASGRERSAATPSAAPDDRRNERAWEPMPLDAAPRRRFDDERRSSRPRSTRATHAHARFSGFKVGAALETADGRGRHRLQHRERDLRPDAVRRARRALKALSDGTRRLHPHRRRRRHRRPDAAVRSCRQLLWEYCGDIERDPLANLCRRRRSGAACGLSQLLPLAVRRARLLENLNLPEVQYPMLPTIDLAGRRHRHGGSAQAARRRKSTCAAGRAPEVAQGDPDDGDPRRAGDRRRRRHGHRARHEAQHGEGHPAVRRRVPEDLRPDGRRRGRPRSTCSGRSTG